MVTYQPEGGDVSVLQKYVLNIPEGPTNPPHSGTFLIPDLIAAVGLRRNSDGDLTIVYHVKWTGLPVSQMTWVPEQDFCQEDLMAIWTAHGRVHTNGELSSLPAHVREISVHKTYPPTMKNRTVNPSSFQGVRTNIGDRGEMATNFPRTSKTTESARLGIDSLASIEMHLAPRSVPQNPTFSGHHPHSRTFRPRRKFSKRTRTGCRSCRTRRKKCDETRPVCESCPPEFHGDSLNSLSGLNCKRLKLPCAGYELGVRKCNPDEKALSLSELVSSNADSDVGPKLSSAQPQSQSQVTPISEDEGLPDGYNVDVQKVDSLKTKLARPANVILRLLWGSLGQAEQDSSKTAEDTLSLAKSPTPKQEDDNKSDVHVHDARMSIAGLLV